MKFFKKLLFILVIGLVIISSTTSHAGQLKSLEVYLDINPDGNGNITMVWDYLDDQGTEHYIPIKGDSITISQLEVEKNGVKYETIENWDINRSREDKKNKAGIIKYGQDYELAWGIGDYGENLFKVSYYVEDIIKAIKDGQILHYRFINDQMSEPPSRVKIVISSYEDLVKEDVLMWAFGFDGEINLVDGKVVAESLKPFNPSNYGHILLSFPLDYFNARDYIDVSFEEVKDEAFIGSDYLSIGDEDWSHDYPEELYVSRPNSPSFPFLFPISVFIMGLLVSFGVIKKANSSIGPRPKDFKGSYYRDIPYDNNPTDIYYLLTRSGLSDYTNYIGYFFLKWIKDGYLIPEEYDHGVFFKKEKLGLRLGNKDNYLVGVEDEFFNIVKDAAGSDGFLEENEFNRWMAKNTKKFTSFLESLDNNSKARLLEEWFLKSQDKRFLFVPYESFENTSKANDLLEKFFMFKNFLLDFSLINERSSINIHLWEDLMLYAGILGITEKVDKEFQKLYPNYNLEESNRNLAFNYIYLANSYSRIISQSYTSHTSSSSSASGFGGSTSIGGGGGGFGGGSGGGTR